jgi:hypothetical protein
MLLSGNGLLCVNRGRAAAAIDRSYIRHPQKKCAGWGGGHVAVCTHSMVKTKCCLFCWGQVLMCEREASSCCKDRSYIMHPRHFMCVHA